MVNALKTSVVLTLLVSLPCSAYPPSITAIHHENIFMFWCFSWALTLQNPL